MDPQPSARCQRRSGTVLELNHCLEQLGRPPRLVTDENGTPRYVGDIETSQRDGGTTSSARRIRGLSVLFDAPDPRELAPWKHPDIRFGRQLAAPDSSSDNGASSLYGERAIDRHPEQIVGRAWLRPFEALAEDGAELIEARLRTARAAHDWRLRHSGLLEQRKNVGIHELQPVAVYEIAFCECDDDFRNPEQLEDQQVLASLGHHSFVGGHHQKTEIDSARANQHAADEVLMARDIDHTDCADAVEQQWRESQVDRYSPPFFLG
jgi:hypothetical protein